MAHVTESQWQELDAAANNAIGFAYAPYSHFRVGAAILLASGRIVAGCNIENASYGLTVCAERVAVFKAIAEEGKGSQVVAVSIRTSPQVPAAPCGACRQVLTEFGPRAVIEFQSRAGRVRLPLADLLPHSFALDEEDSGA